MAKITMIELGPDDPIFHSRPQVFKPVPRPSHQPDPMLRAMNAAEARLTARANRPQKKKD